MSSRRETLRGQNFKEHTRLYPNPTNTIVNIELGRNGPAELTMFNSLGDLVLQEKLQLKLTTISLDQLVPGIYHYRLTYSDGDSESGKLTKQ